MKPSDDQVTQYEEDGYFVMEGLMTDEEVEELRVEAERIAAGEVDFPVELVEFEPHAAPETPPLDRLRKINECAFNNAVFLEHARNAKLLEAAAAVLGPDLKLFGDQMFIKPPGGMEKTYHQDSPYFKVEPMALVSSWVAMDEVTVDNGCLFVVPGTHKGGARDHSDVWMVGEREDKKIPDAMIDFDREVPIELAKGSVSFHHSLLMHRSGSNNTQTRRRGLATHYMSARSKWTGDVAQKPQYPLLAGREYEGCV